jgi:hypothetical protein
MISLSPDTVGSGEVEAEREARQKDGRVSAT